MSLRLALREIRNHPRFAAFFTLNLALGFAGFAALDAFERSVSGELRQRSKAYLAADVAVSAGRPLADEEVRHLDSLAGADARISRAAQLFSMAGGEGRSRLVEIRAVDTDFPLYGAVGAADPERPVAVLGRVGETPLLLDGEHPTLTRKGLRVIGPFETFAEYADANSQSDYVALGVSAADWGGVPDAMDQAGLTRARTPGMRPATVERSRVTPSRVRTGSMVHRSTASTLEMLKV